MTHEVSPRARTGSGTTRAAPSRTRCKYDFNTDETVKFPSAVALIWRWTGDNAFRDELYDFSKRNLRYVVEQLDDDGDGWPEGTGNVERGGMGVEKLDNSVYLIRGLYDLADMARSKGDAATYGVGQRTSRARLHQRFEGTWWMRGGVPVRGLDRRRAGRRAEQPAAGQALDRRDADGGRADGRRARRRRA